MIKLKNKQILLTGGKTFLGLYVFKELIEQGIPEENITVTSPEKDDLMNKEVCARVVKGKDVVIHCTGRVGGIGYAMRHPAKLFYDNISMALNIVEESCKAKIEKLTFVGSACSYPRSISQPFKEEDFWSGYPDEINATYGIAKKVALVQAQAYRKEYGFNSIHLILTNLYGPGDDFSLKDSHVVAALIRKAIDAVENGNKELAVWGTGNASREFLYVEDAAEAIVLATEKYDKEGPINVGNGQETTIKDLVELICELVGFKGKIIWDASKPDGQPRRCLDVSKAEKEFEFKARTALREGIKRTIEWYKANRAIIK